MIPTLGFHRCQRSTRAKITTPRGVPHQGEVFGFNALLKRGGLGKPTIIGSIFIQLFWSPWKSVRPVPGPLLKLVGCFPVIFKGQLDAQESTTSSNEMHRVLIGRELSRVL